MLRLLASLATGIAVGVSTYREEKRKLQDEQRQRQEKLETIVNEVRRELPLEQRIPFARFGLAITWSRFEDLSRLISIPHISALMRLSGMASIRAYDLGFGDRREQEELGDVRKDELYAALADDHAFLLRCAEYDTELIEFLTEYHARTPEEQPIPTDKMPSIDAATRIASICQFHEF